MSILNPDEQKELREFLRIKRLELARKRQIRDSVIHLTNPKLGDVFHIGKYDWQVVKVIQYPQSAYLKYNRGLLLIQKLNSETVYVVPHRLNGYIENRTIVKLDLEYSDALSHLPSMPTQSDLPYDIEIVPILAGLETQYNVVFRKHKRRDMYSLRALPVETKLPYEEEAKRVLPRIKWAMKCIGGRINQAWNTVIFPDEMLEDAVTENEDDWLDISVFAGESHTEFGGVDFSVTLLLPNVAIEPDAALLSHSVDERPRVAVFYPHDLHATIVALSHYFDTDHIVEHIKMMKEIGE